MRGGYGFRAEVLIEQYRQGGEAAAVSGVDEEQHHQHGPQQSAVDTVVQTCSRHTAIDITKIT